MLQVPLNETKASFKKRAKEWDMDEENESEIQDNHDYKALPKGVNEVRGRKSEPKKGSFSYNNFDEIEDSDTEDIFEL